MASSSSIEPETVVEQEELDTSDLVTRTHRRQRLSRTSLHNVSHPLGQSKRPIDFQLARVSKRNGVEDEYKEENRPWIMRAFRRYQYGVVTYWGVQHIWPCRYKWKVLLQPQEAA